ncbi:MAG: class I SAM-dependent methyltransferase [Gammaproteobacteria bacterium]|nr:class I SAM-dependent methyltransferase [Gammaproteobacteria bacterium]
MKKPRSKSTMADTADKHILYQKSVQSPEFELDFFRDRYNEIRGGFPQLMREDFCGSALLSTEWCKLDPKNKAIGVDVCQDTLNWGIEHNIKPAGEDVASRVQLLNEDVLKVLPQEKADVVCAMNFSYCIFKKRDILKRYFENVLKGLNSDGLFFLDLLGGTETMDVVEEDRDVDDDNFVYVWEQEKFNPINNHILCHIHFDFADGSRMENAFTYNWRLWSLPELQEILLEAGFSHVHIYWEEFAEDEDDPENDYLVGTGNYRAVTQVDQQESWLAYIVAEV